ncbi:MAG TPA: hypothetical protein VGH87_18565 [Polyangiaceae bacterium]|jgi:hypothetical protein
MAHWEHRDEPKWKTFQYNQPYAKGLKRLREEVLGKTDFDPATLWQWGTMQGMALIQVLKDCEGAFGAEGQRIVCDALKKTGLDVGRQILDGVEIPKDLTPAEFASFYATVINRIAYASLESPRIEADGTATFDILWCPHQDHYGAFDCRVQRYFVQGMLDAAREKADEHGFDVRFDTTIPSGAPTCHFTMWKPTEEERAVWGETTKLIEAKALAKAKKRGVSEEGA